MRHTWRTISYFTVWGTIYGLVIGVLTGATGLFIGLLLGAIFGIMIGSMSGFAIGLITALIHVRAFHEDVDIILYQRRIAVFNGLLAGTVGLSVLILITTNVFARPPRGTDLADFYPLIATFIPKTVLLIALCVAYISSHYPGWIIREFYSPDPLPEPYSVQKFFAALVTRMGRLPHIIIALGLGMCFYLTEILSSEGIALTIAQPLLALVGSVFMMPFVILYLIAGNAVLLTVIKHLIFDDGLLTLSAYHYKSLITASSFLFTVLMTNWYWIFAPIHMVAFSGFFSTPDNTHPVGKAAPIILGLFMAFHVSNTLALPDDDKAKRKEMTHDHTTA